MSYEPWQIAVLQRYGLAKPDGSPVMSKLEVLNDEVPGPKVDPEVIKRLFLADTTPDHIWTALNADRRSWVFNQAGGGDAAMAQSVENLNYIKQRFVHAKGDKKWLAHEDEFKLSLGLIEGGSADQDVCLRMRGSFGYYRMWPGYNGIYEKVVVALTTFLKQYKKLLEMNKTVDENLQQFTEPRDIETWQVMQEINKKVTSWIAAKWVRTDVRLASHQDDKMIYNDDHVMAIAPLTYKAAVEYGFQGWHISNRDKFNRVAQGELSTNPWDGFISNGGIVVMVQFHNGMPWWFGNSDEGGYKVLSLENLLLNLTRDMVRQNPDSWPVIDEENNEKLTVAQIKNMIRFEATRTDDTPVPADVPEVRGPFSGEVPHPVYADRSKHPSGRGGQAVGATSDAARKDAEEIITHFDLCLKEIQKWAASFKGKPSSVEPGVAGAAARRPPR